MPRNRADPPANCGFEPAGPIGLSFHRTPPFAMAISNYVLLANTNAEKGYDLILKVAALLPDVPFLVIASQSPLREAVEAYEAAGLRNVTAIGRVDDMDPVYANAAIVAVPSYRFRESFSRVCIEAQRYGKPVIGSDKGNVPYLLEESGVSLPEDAGLWAAEIKRLLGDDAYYAERQAEGAGEFRPLFFRRAGRGAGRADRRGRGALPRRGRLRPRQHAAHHADDRQHLPAHRRARRCRRGGGASQQPLPDAQPRLCERGVRSETGGAAPRLRHRVRDAFLRPGARGVQFRKRRVGARLGELSRQRACTRRSTISKPPGGSSAIPYEESDVRDYFCGDLAYRKPAEALVGFHAGSKTGMWLVKRWPYFPELARRLRRRGIRVASFGMASEYVEGTENRTGATSRRCASRCSTAAISSPTTAD